jgi:hypothetical protein
MDIHLSLIFLGGGTYGLNIYHSTGPHTATACPCPCAQLTKHCAHECVWGSRCIDSHLIDLSTSWM